MTDDESYFLYWRFLCIGSSIRGTKRRERSAVSLEGSEFNTSPRSEKVVLTKHKRDISCLQRRTARRDSIGWQTIGIARFTWRRERDSNPRYPFEYSGFQDRLFQPLTHPSAIVNTMVSSLYDSLTRSTEGNQAIPELNRARHFVSLRDQKAFSGAYVVLSFKVTLEGRSSRLLTCKLRRLFSQAIDAVSMLAASTRNQEKTRERKRVANGTPCSVIACYLQRLIDSLAMLFTDSPWHHHCRFTTGSTSD